MHTISVWKFQNLAIIEFYYGNYDKGVEHEPTENLN